MIRRDACWVSVQWWTKNRKQKEGSIQHHWSISNMHWHRKISWSFIFPIFYEKLVAISSLNFVINHDDLFVEKHLDLWDEISKRCICSNPTATFSIYSRKTFYIHEMMWEWYAGHSFKLPWSLRKMFCDVRLSIRIQNLLVPSTMTPCR